MTLKAWMPKYQGDLWFVLWRFHAAVGGKTDVWFSFQLLSNLAKSEVASNVRRTRGVVVKLFVCDVEVGRRAARSRLRQKIRGNVEMWDVCRNAASVDTETERNSAKCWLKAAEVVYHTSSSGRLPATSWQLRSIINIKLAAQIANTTVPFWDSPGSAACRRIGKLRANGSRGSSWYLLSNYGWVKHWSSRPVASSVPGVLRRRPSGSNGVCFSGKREINAAFCLSAVTLSAASRERIELKGLL